MGRRHATAACALVVGFSVASLAHAADEAAPPGQVSDLGQLSLEELSNLTVTSVSRRQEPIATAPSAVYVITAEDIRRSAARSIPEALRQAPNLEITRVDALDYSITARGFGGFESSEKLLVLIDGRSVYTPLFSGVDWDQHHLLFDDIERIEVISGPGGTLYGANAVNGVVNITSKTAFDTLGALADGSVGTLDSDVALRFGAPIGETAAGRVYLTAFRRGASETAGGDSIHDGWDSVQGGFRLDWAQDGRAATLQGDMHSGDLKNSLGLSGFIRGQNVLGRFTAAEVLGGELQMQAYYDHFSREARLIHDELTTWDILIQQTLSRGPHKIVAGGGFRWLSDDFRTLSEPQLLAPPHRRTTIANLFAQDEIALTSDLSLTVGLKVENNSYTSTELMPNARIAWRLNDRQFLWGAVSRAVRDPSRIERDFQIPGVVIPGVMQSETLVAYEAGYRGRLTDRANLSVSVYYDDYDDLRSNDLTPPGVLPLFVGNSVRGRVYGVEAWSDLDITNWWRLRFGGALLDRKFEPKPGGLEQAQLKSTGSDPAHWAKVSSRMNLTPNVDLDLGLRAYGHIPDSPAAGLTGVPAYAEASARIAWRPRPGLELALSGENLFHRRHVESIDERRRYIPRSAAVTLRWTP